MGDVQPSLATPSKPPRVQVVWLGLTMGVGIVAGRIAGDAVRELLGWWGSLGVGVLVAIVAVLATAFLISAWQGRGRRAVPLSRPTDLTEKVTAANVQ